jgi:UDPglucose 6-dehydrogenase
LPIFEEMRANSASVIGLGKLGVCLAASLAYDALPVVGADVDEDVVKRINQGQATRQEPFLQEYIDEAGKDLQATTDVEQAIHETDISFIVVNTPSTKEGRYSLEYVEAACESIGAAIGDKDSYHVVVVTSTVFPGSTTGEILNTLESASGKTAGEDFGLCYSPEFIAIGDVIRGLEDPDFFLVGEHTERAGDVLSSIYNRLGTEDSPVARMDPDSAEVTKMALNSYVTTKISFVNTLAQICDGTGANVDTVTEALALDNRISGTYLTAGARYGGPCFPRDNQAFSKLANDTGTAAPIAESTDKVNDRHTVWIADAIDTVREEGDRVAILGLTYKPGTDIVEESQGTELVRRFQDEWPINCHDPSAGAPDLSRLGNSTRLCGSAAEALKEASVAVIATQWDEYTDPSTYSSFDGTIVDPWGLFQTSELPDAVEYDPIGRPSEPSEQ